MRTLFFMIGWLGLTFSAQAQKNWSDLKEEDKPIIGLSKTGGLNAMDERGYIKTTLEKTPFTDRNMIAYPLKASALKPFLFASYTFQSGDQLKVLTSLYKKTIGEMAAQQTSYDEKLPCPVGFTSITFKQAIEAQAQELNIDIASLKTLSDMVSAITKTMQEKSSTK